VHQVGREPDRQRCGHRRYVGFCGLRSSTNQCIHGAYVLCSRVGE
jgi:hypothetical protein